MKGLWSAAIYWPTWMIILVTSFLVREVWALASGRSVDTLSYWVWQHLNVTAHERVSQWSALDFLTFGIWLVLVAWLSFHFWFHDFT
jgi:hypothetical protein